MLTAAAFAPIRRGFQGATRRFCILSEADLPVSLAGSKFVSVRLQSAAEQLRPSDGRKGEKSIGVGDRGAGLVYRDGRPSSSQALAGREQEANFPREGVWVVKIQPPLDVSSDSAGGIGRITPTTLLLSDRRWSFVRFVREEDEGHFPLLRCALSEARQVAYRYAEEFEEDGQKLRVYTEVPQCDACITLEQKNHKSSVYRCESLPKVRRRLSPSNGHKGTACADSSDLEDVRRKMENSEVLACFLDLGEDGMTSHDLWTEKLPEVPSFDVLSSESKRLKRPFVAQKLPLTKVHPVGQRSQDMSCGCCGESRPLSSAPVSKNPADFYAYHGKDVWYTCQPDVALEPRCAASGTASALKCPPMTLPGLLKKAAEKSGQRPALKVERPCPSLEGNKAPAALPEDAWMTWTWQQYYEDVRTAGKSFVKLGLEMYGTVAIWGFNSPEWMLSTFAASMVGAKSAGLYPTDTAETAAFKVAHSGASIVVIEDGAKLSKLFQALARRGSMKVKAFVLYAAEVKEEHQGLGVPVLTWSDLIALGKSEDNSKMENRWAMVKPGNCAALVYTSGTTGEPKAVMLSHDNIISVCSSFISITALHMGFCTGPGPERLLSYLPLSHAAGLMVDMVFPLVATATSSAPYVVTYFARPYDLKVGSFKDRLCVARPTAFLGVPLVWEKVADKLRTLGAKNTGVKKTLVDWAKKQGLNHARSQQLGGDGAKSLSFLLADKLVLSKVRAALGLDQLKVGLTGAAPIRVDTLEFFGALGIQINECYGMSESTAACTLSTQRCHLWGSCGFQLPGFEVKAFQVDPDNINNKKACALASSLDSQDEACQGEVCFRGRGIMMGYLAQANLGAAHVKEIEAKTAGAIDKEGWLHSGDKGLVTDKGMIKITGRYKELIIGEGGENIAPVPIEDQVKASCDGINEVLMIGDKRKLWQAL
eukprot:symbB.v1.2.020738.t1/scaffold1762.1/size182224/5